MNREVVKLIEELLAAIEREDRIMVAGYYTELNFYLAETYYGIHEILSKHDIYYCEFCLDQYPAFKNILTIGGIIE